MKVIWEPEDIKGGLIYGRVGLGEQWMLGWDSSKSGSRYVACSLRDGMVTTSLTKEEMADMLTKEGYIPALLLTSGLFGEYP